VADCARALRAGDRSGRLNVLLADVIYDAGWGSNMHSDEGPAGASLGNCCRARTCGSPNTERHSRICRRAEWSEESRHDSGICSAARDDTNFRTQRARLSVLNSFGRRPDQAPLRRRASSRSSWTGGTSAGGRRQAWMTPLAFHGHLARSGSCPPVNRRGPQQRSVGCGLLRAERSASVSV